MQIPTPILIVSSIAIFVIILEFIRVFDAYRSRKFWEKFVEKYCNNNEIGE